MTDIEEVVMDRNAALRGLDKEMIRAYSEKYRIPVPDNETDFWAGVHKARLHITCFTDAEKQVSRNWLKEHGYTENMA
jgi:hypothetical protein